MTVNDAVGPRRPRDDLIRSFFAAPHVQAIPRRWDEKGDYSHFAVLHCASHPAMLSADHSPLTERPQWRLPVAACENLRVFLDALMEFRYLWLLRRRCRVSYDHWSAEVLWRFGSRSRTRFPPGGVGLSLNGPAGGAHAPRTATAVNLSDRAPFLYGTPSRRA